MTGSNGAGRNGTLVMLPTYNEAGTVGGMHEAIRAALPDAEILFIDDSSPDGTGRILDEMAARDDRLQILHRPGKLGIGSAHLDGIAWAYDHGVRLLITMDSDLAHSPDYIHHFVTAAEDRDVVVGSRFMKRDSLLGWTPWRRLLTHTGHILTRILLRLPYDATGAFRAYRLDRIPRPAFSLVRSTDYAFFFESLHVLALNGLSVGEIPIHLPTRTYGSSKMRMRDIFRGISRLFTQSYRATFDRSSLIVGLAEREPTGPANPPQARDD